jgi:ABC-2 type transport system permease protein
MILQLLTIARNAFIESVRQPVLLLLVLLSGILQVFNTWNTGFAMADAETGKITGDNKLLFDIGLGTVFVIGVLLAGFIATAVMSREIENKTVLTVVSKPVPRYTLVLGKYLGVAGAILGAIVVMLVFLMLGIRHGVMSTTADELDGPVLCIGVLSVFLALALGGWCNFFYGWNFAQTAMSLLIPFSIASYVLVLLFDKNWKVQPLSTDFNAEVMLASAALTMAILVLTAVATAASTRLGQVMTIVVCCGVFLMALLSNHLIGRKVFQNNPLGKVEEIRYTESDLAMNEPGQVMTLKLLSPLNTLPAPKTTLYYSPSPSGFPMLNRDAAPFTGDLTKANDTKGRDVPPSLVVVECDRQSLKAMTVGGKPLPVIRPISEGDYVFLERTQINRPAMVAWTVIPNMQLFWLLDAVTQNRAIPVQYVLMAGVYALAEIGVFLSLAVILFQRRDVG